MSRKHRQVEKLLEENDGHIKSPNAAALAAEYAGCTPEQAALLLSEMEANGTLTLVRLRSSQITGVFRRETADQWLETTLTWGLTPQRRDTIGSLLGHEGWTVKSASLFRELGVHPAVAQHRLDALRKLGVVERRQGLADLNEGPWLLAFTVRADEMPKFKGRPRAPAIRF